MSKLNDCYRKAGKTLRVKDRKAIAHAMEMGYTPEEAVQLRAEQLQGYMKEIADYAEEKGANVNAIPEFDSAEFEEWFADKAGAYSMTPEASESASGMDKLNAQIEQYFTKVFDSLPPEVRERFTPDEYVNAAMQRMAQDGAFHDAAVQPFRAYYTPLRDAIRKANRGSGFFKQLKDWGREASEFGIKAISPLLTADRQLRNISAEIADIFYQQSNSQTSADRTGLFNVLPTKRGKWMERLDAIEAKHSENDREQGYRQLQQKASNESLNPFAKEMRQFLAEYYLYAKNHAKTLGHIDNYFHRWWDVEQIRERPEDFEQMLEKLGYVETAAIRKALEEGLGGIEFNITEFKQAYGPGASASKKLTLDIEGTDAAGAQAGFLLNDPSAIMRNYLMAMTRRVEYERRAGGYYSVYDPERVGTGSPEIPRSALQFSALHKTLGPLMVQEGLLAENWADRSNKAALFNRAARQAVDQNYLDWDLDPNKEAKWYSPHEKIHHVMDTLDAPQKQKVEQILDAYMGRLGQDMNPQMRKMMSAVMAYESFLTLLFSALASIPDLAGPLINARDFHGVKEGFKTYVRTVNNREEAVRRAHDLGTIQRRMADQALLELAGHQHTSKFAQNAMEKLFQWNGQEMLTRMSRVAATAVGENFIKDHARLASGGNQQSAQYLAQLNLDADTVNAWVDAGSPAWSPSMSPDIAPIAEQVTDAIGQFVDSSVVRPNAAHRPIWASDPKWMLLWHLKSFFYSYGKVIMGGILRNMRTAYHNVDGNAVVKAAYASLPMLLAAGMLLPLAAAGLELREIIQYWGDDPTEYQSAVDYGLNLTSRAGMFGVLELGGAFFGLNTYSAGPMAVAGPTAQHIDVLFNGEPETKLTRSVPGLNQIPALKDLLFDGL